METGSPDGTLFYLKICFSVRDLQLQCFLTIIIVIGKMNMFNYLMSKVTIVETLTIWS